MSSTAILHRSPATSIALGSDPIRWERILLVAISAFFLLAELPVASHKPFWFDELSSLFVVQRPTLADMFRTMPADGNPPLYFLLARLCLYLPIGTELAMRLPSIVAFHATALLAYLFIRRVASASAAFLTMSLVLGSEIAEHHAIEARAYSLLLFFMMGLLCCWQAARRGRKKTLAYVGIAACASCAVLTHQYGVVYALGPIFSAEIAVWFAGRRIDSRALAAAVVGSLTIGITYPPMLRAQKTVLAAIADCPHFTFHPQLSDLGVCEEMLPTFLPALILLVVLLAFLFKAAVPRFQLFSPEPTRAFPEEFAAANMLILFVPLFLLMTGLSTQYFVSRYAIGSTLGLALACGLLASYAELRRPYVHTIIFVVVFYCLTCGAMRFYFEAHPKSVSDYGNSLFATTTGSEPIVIESAVTFSPTWWYAAPAMRPRLHYLSDIPYSLRNIDVLPEYCLWMERRFTPMQMDNYNTFLAEHHRFLVYSRGQARQEWLHSRLITAGWNLRLLAAGKPGSLYEATAPGFVEP